MTGAGEAPANARYLAPAGALGKSTCPDTEAGAKVDASEIEERAFMDAMPVSGPQWWGPPFWTVYHLVAAMAPAEFTDDDREFYANFYRTYGRAQPCRAKCKPHYERAVAENPPPVCCRYHLFKYTVEFHNDANRRINAEIDAKKRPGPKHPVLSFKEALREIIMSQQEGNSGGLGGVRMMQRFRSSMNGVADISHMSAAASNDTMKRDGNTGLSKGTWLGAALAVILVVLLIGIAIVLIVRAQKSRPRIQPRKN